MVKPNVAWQITVFCAALLIAFALVVKLFVSAEVSSTLVSAILAVVVLLFLCPRLFELAELTVTKGGLKAKLRAVEQKAEMAEQSVKNAEKKIDQLVAFSMSESLFSNLQKLATGNFGRARVDDGFQRELRHLRNLGYITVKGYIRDIPGETERLSEYIDVTPIGKEFIGLRESMSQNNQKQRAPI